MANPPTEHVSYWAGLDLGPTGQFTGLAVLERRGKVNQYGLVRDSTYAVRHLARFPPNTPYGDIKAAVQGVFAEPGLKGGHLVVDQTAVGRAVFELFRDGLRSVNVRAVSVTAGSAAQIDDLGTWQVPKKDLVGNMQVLLQGRRLKVAPTLELAPTLVTELQQFQLKAVPISADALIEWRERPHDDLVLAVAVAAWLAERPSVGCFLAVIDTCPADLPKWWPRS